MNKITIEIPVSLIQEVLDAGIIQTHGTPRSAELRARDVERRQHHFAEIVIAIILKEFNNQKRISHNKK